MRRLENKVAVVTGASKGIGAGIAKGLAEAGASIAVNYASSREGADRVVEEIARAGAKAIAVQGDVSKIADVKRLFEQTHLAFGRVDVLVNNAGVYKVEPIEDVTEAEFHRQFNVNVLGTLLMSREALRYFPPEGAVIINIGSVASSNPPPHSVVYSATKSAVDAMTISLSRELGARKIRVNAIAPGGTATEGLAATGILDSRLQEQLIAQTPLGRFGEPNDIARVAVFLASDEAQWLTGERIAASGGWR